MRHVAPVCREFHEFAFDGQLWALILEKKMHREEQRYLSDPSLQVSAKNSPPNQIFAQFLFSL